MPITPKFLTVEELYQAHEELLARHGGEGGMISTALLESAVAQPSATYQNRFLHQDLFEMAAAYIFHMIRNHPFIDGNKRTGTYAALTFLSINGVRPRMLEDEGYKLALAVANEKLGKSQIAAFLRAWARRK